MKSSALDVAATPTIAFEPLLTSSFDIHLSVEIAAAQRCLVYALTLPEYLETWLRIPDTVSIRAIPSNAPNELRVERYCFQQQVGSICISFEAISDDSIRFSWRKSAGGGAAPSLVHITLAGEPGRCTLDLTHSGFRSEEESQWHLTLWTRSLENLSRLLSR